jgi:hypothetical protein
MPEIDATPAETENRTPFRLTISVDTTLYALFFLVSLALRLIDLNTIVLNDAEAHEALAVFRAINPIAVGTPLVAHDPLMFTFNALAMVVGGANNVTARLATALLGAAIVLMPILFRRWLGRSNALIMSVLLALSPVLLTSSRTMSGAVWTLALAIGAVWLLGRYLETHRAPWAIGGMIAAALMLIGTEAAGFWMVIMLAVGLVFAVVTADDPDHALRHQLRATFRELPWIRASILTVIVLAVVGTVFLFHTDGVGAFGDVITRGLSGFILRPAQFPLAYPLFTSLIYEPVLWIFGLIGAWIVLREGGKFLERGLIGWLLVGILATLIYPGAGAEHALWLTLPLIGLSVVSIIRILTPIADSLWPVPGWGPWLHGLAVVATLAICGINLLYVGRAVLTSAPSLIPSLAQPFHLVLVILTIVLSVILFFLVGSVWGARAAWHGMGIGVLIVLSIYGAGAGWRASVVNSSDPREFWRPHAVSQNLNLLQKALINTSLRASGMPYDMPLNVAWSDDSALAWVIRDYRKAQYVTATSSALTGPAILAPKVDDKPQLGAAYVGEPFAVYLKWDRGTMQDWDILAWLYSRETRVEPDITDRVVLWVRSDVYGVPSDSLTSPAPASAPSG